MDDPAAETLAISEDHGHPVMAAKAYRGWRSVYCAAGPVNAPVLREIFR